MPKKLFIFSDALELPKYGSSSECVIKLTKVKKDKNNNNIPKQNV